MSIEYFHNGADSWAKTEKWMIQSIFHQINAKWPNHKNLVINTTWLGPAFDSWERLLSKNYCCDNLFWLALVDPIAMLPHHIKQVEEKVQAKSVKYIGLGFSGKYRIDTPSIAILDGYIPSYEEQQILPLSFKFRYINYNRKPHAHRIDFVNKILEHKLDSHGIVTLDTTDNYNYDIGQGRTCNKVSTIPPEFIHENIKEPTLGSLYLWQNHFLNIVSETEFFPWDNMFVTEKTWKPILGLRPFIINGQTQIYSWLRDQGFKTFNHYWHFADLENVKEFEVHDSIIKVIKYICSADEATLHEIYRDMLPDIQYNKQRFFEFAQEQKLKVNSLF